MSAMSSGNTMSSGTAISPSGAKPRPFFAPGRVLIYTLLIVTSIYYLIPLYVMVITSLKDLDQIREGNIFIPTLQPSFDAWIKAWSQACTGLNCTGLAPGFWNSGFISVPSVSVSIAVSSILPCPAVAANLVPMPPRD